MTKRHETALAIPEELAEFLDDVHRRIVEGDDATMVPSDDLLQCDVACGGLDRKGRGRFTFTYVAGDRCRWQFSLTPAQLEVIGAMRTLPLFACPTCQCAFSIADATCRCCDVVLAPPQRAPDGANFTVRIDDESFGVSTVAELDAIIAPRIHPTSRFVITVLDPTGTRALHAGLAMDGSFASWCGPDRSPPYATSEGNEHWEGEMSFVRRGRSVKVPRCYEIDLPHAREVLRAFVLDPTQLPGAIEWVERGLGPFVLATA